MRIINKTLGRETTISAAVSIITDCDDGSALRDLVIRLLEELTFTADDSVPTLSAQQLSRVLEYKFRVEY